MLFIVASLFFLLQADRQTIVAANNTIISFFILWFYFANSEISCSIYLFDVEIFQWCITVIFRVSDLIMVIVDISQDAFVAFQCPPAATSSIRYAAITIIVIIVLNVIHQVSHHRIDG